MRPLVVLDGSKAFDRDVKARLARRARRVARRAAMPALPKPARVKRKSLWRHRGCFFFADHIHARPGARPWVEFSDGEQAFTLDLLHPETDWEYLGPGPDPERDLDDPPARPKKGAGL